MAYLHECLSVLETVSLRSAKNVLYTLEEITHFESHYGWCRERVFHVYVADSTRIYTVVEGREVAQSGTRKNEVHEKPTFSSVLQLP